ncbi:MAG: GntR family transcriptional regulator [Planctomycetota bacterium]
MLLLLLDRHTGTPVYRQIVDQVRYLVASGGLTPGAELPSTRGLAAEHGLNPMTVSKAYSELEREGVLERRPGRPLVIAARPSEGVATDRETELARALETAVTAARQLGFTPDEAAALYARLLTEAEEQRTAEAPRTEGPTS